MEKNLKKLISELKGEANLFNLLNEDELEKILPFLEFQRYTKGTTFFHEGDPGNFLGILVSGRLEAKKKNVFQRSQIVLAVLDKGSFVGELSMLDERDRSATVIALEDSELVVLRRNALDSFMEQCPEAGVKILKRIGQVVSLRLRGSVDRLGIVF